MIAAKFCPPEFEGVCSRCDRYRQFCRQVWHGIAGHALCRDCRKGLR